jgi:hypothetical protein
MMEYVARGLAGLAGIAALMLAGLAFASVLEGGPAVNLGVVGVFGLGGAVAVAYAMGWEG